MTIEELLILHEGLKLKPYRCTAGKLTIGVGRNIQDNGISEDEAIYMLRNDIERCKRELRGIFKDFDSFDENIKMVLIDMIFNLGEPKFLKFKKFINAIKEKDLKKAAHEMSNSEWALQVPERVRHLKKILLGRDAINRVCTDARRGER